MVNNNLSEQLRMTRLAHHLSQEELASRAHITQEYLSMIESGERTPPVALISWIMWCIEHEEQTLGRAAFTEKYNQGGLQMEVGRYPYLASEDTSFARAFRLTEDEVLNLFGGLAGYVRHRKNRTQCRDNSIEIPGLSTDLEGEVEKYELSEVSEKEIAKTLVNEQVQKVKGGLSTIEMNARFTVAGAMQAKNEEQVKEMEIAKIREWYAATHGVAIDSQSTKDFAEAEYKRRQTGHGTIPQPL